MSLWSGFTTSYKDAVESVGEAIHNVPAGEALAFTTNVVDFTLAVVAIGVATEELVISPEAIAGFAIVGGISSLIQCEMGLTESISNYLMCKQQMAQMCNCVFDKPSSLFDQGCTFGP